MRPLLVASFVVFLGCTAHSPRHLYSHSAQAQGDERVGQYISSQWSLETSSFWLEGPEGLILFDTQFLPSALRKEVEYAEQYTGKVAKLGLTGGPELLDRQTEYLHTVVEAVAAARQQGLDYDGAMAQATEKVTQRYPNHHYPVFLPRILRAEWVRQEARPATPP